HNRGPGGFMQDLLDQKTIRNLHACLLRWNFEIDPPADINKLLELVLLTNKVYKNRCQDDLWELLKFGQIKKFTIDYNPPGGAGKAKPYPWPPEP
ncbi:hypothetical protein JXO59_11070, partial [candidate division KSB1 bacterium]|nr:hypothetical protein [candidate division KSB1 bacterium]